MSPEKFESFSQEQPAPLAPVEEVEGGFLQRSKERLTTIASEVGGIAVAAAGVVIEKGGELVDATVEFVKDEENQETAKRIVKVAGGIALEGALGESGIDVWSRDGGIKKVKAAKAVAQLATNPFGLAKSAGVGMAKQGRKHLTTLGLDVAKKKFA